MAQLLVALVSIGWKGESSRRDIWMMDRQVDSMTNLKSGHLTAACTHAFTMTLRKGDGKVQKCFLERGP